MKIFKDEDLDSLQNKELIKYQLYKQGFKREFKLQSTIEIDSSEKEWENFLINFHKSFYKQLYGK